MCCISIAVRPMVELLGLVGSGTPPDAKDV
jgi:hypothetical protein